MHTPFFCSFPFRAKHPVKVQVWGGISWKGRTPIVIFKVTMNAEGYENIFWEAHLPFLRVVYPSGHRLMQDNDPQHTSNRVVHFLWAEGVKWWKIPPESPDCNPSENLWHEPKGFCAGKSNQQENGSSLMELKSLGRQGTLLNAVSTSDTYTTIQLEDGPTGYWSPCVVFNITWKRSCFITGK